MKNTAAIFSRRTTISILIFAIVYTAMHFAFPLECSDCKYRKVSKRYKEIYEKARTGDLILVESSDFFSNMIKNIDGCQFAGVKVVYEISYGEKSLIVSDAQNLADSKSGLLLKDMQEYFDDYDKIKVALFRPKNLNFSHFKNLDKLAQRALNANESPIPYDFLFYNDDRTQMTCSKVLLSAFGEDKLLDRSREANWPLKTTLPCDLKMDELTQKTEWIDYWE